MSRSSALPRVLKGLLASASLTICACASQDDEVTGAVDAVDTATEEVGSADTAEPADLGSPCPQGTWEYDVEPDGTADYRSTDLCDAGGDLLTRQHDYGADSSVDARDTYSYDTAGNMLTAKYSDGSSYVYTYDLGGVVLEELYVDRDGDRWAVTTHAPHGRVTHAARGSFRSRRSVRRERERQGRPRCARPGLR